MATKKVNKQAAANVDLFSALPIGAFFTTVSPFSACIPFRLHERYQKIDDTTVKATDGRKWPFAFTEASGSSVVIVPEGARSCAAFDVNYCV